MTSKGIGLSMVAVGMGLLAAEEARAQFTVFSQGGDSAASITSTVNSFRSAVGNPNQGVGGGPFTSGRREINWDAPALDAFADPNHMPADFFNNNSKRGAVLSTPGSGFFVSQRDGGNPSNPALRFGSINSTYNAEFGVFSAQRLFVADGSTITDVTFRVPSAPDREATVNGFGSVFTDVDAAGSSWMEFYGVGNVLLGTQFVPTATAGSAGLSFLGVVFDTDRIERVRIVAGNTAIGANVNDGVFYDGLGVADVVAMDDFIYGEPVPAPGAALAGGLVLAGTMTRRRR